MAIVYFPSLVDADAVDVDFVDAAGGSVTMRLLVDSGFTGEASIVLPRYASSLVRKFIDRARAEGALMGSQERGWVFCRLPDINFEGMMIAVVSNVAPLHLPGGVDGMVGLTFLRYFARWGSERTPNQKWRFFLETIENNSPRT